MAAKQTSRTKQLQPEQVKLKQIDGQDDEEGFEYVVVPPDGGFGWVIAFAAMVGGFFLISSQIHWYFFPLVVQSRM